MLIDLCTPGDFTIAKSMPNHTHYSSFIWPSLITPTYREQHYDVWCEWVLHALSFVDTFSWLIPVNQTWLTTIPWSTYHMDAYLPSITRSIPSISPPKKNLKGKDEDLAKASALILILNHDLWASAAPSFLQL